MPGRARVRSARRGQEGRERAWGSVGDKVSVRGCREDAGALEGAGGCQRKKGAPDCPSSHAILGDSLPRGSAGLQQHPSPPPAFLGAHPKASP